MKAIRKAVLASVLAMIGGSVLAAEPIGVVKRSQGDVRIERNGEHVRGARGSLLYTGDRVITGQNGYASVTMRRTAPLTLGPGNDVPLARYAAEDLPVVKSAPPPILQGLASYFAVNRQR